MDVASLFDRERVAGWPLAARALLVAVAYLVTGYVSLSLRIDEGPIVPIWLASGVALAGVLAWGPRIAIGTFAADLLLGAFVSDLPAGIAFGVALGDTAEVLAAAWITLAIGETLAFSHARCVLGLAIAAPAAAAASASVAVLLLGAGGQLVLDTDRAWVRYWLSTVSGMVIVTPLLLTWLRGSWPRLRTRRLAEGILLGVGIGATTWLIFTRASWNFLDMLVVLPFFTWAIVRFGTRGATGATALFAAVIAYGVLERHVVLSGTGTASTADIMQVLVVVLAVGNLTVAATLNQRDEANVRLKELLESFDLSQRIAHVGSWEMRLDGSDRVWCSDELCRMLHLHPSDDGRVARDDFVAAAHDLDRDRIERTIEHCIRLGAALDLEHRVSDGSGRVLRMVAAIEEPSSNDSAQPRLVGSVLDVTDVHRLERFQSDLISTASHELRTPLTSVLGFAQTLHGSWARFDESDRRRFVAIILEQARRLDRLVEETLLQSRVDAGAVRPQVRSFLLGRSVRRVAEMLELDDVELDLPPGLFAVGDPEQFEQVIENLLTNAVKYGAPPIAVRLRQRTEDVVEVRVEDHGPGIPPSFAPRAFERFARGPDVGTAPGTGLGLSISKGLVEAIGGTIHHERWDGVTAFVVRLPGERRRAGAAVDTELHGARSDVER